MAKSQKRKAKGEERRAKSEQRRAKSEQRTAAPLLHWPHVRRARKEDQDDAVRRGRRDDRRHDFFVPSGGRGSRSGDPRPSRKDGRQGGLRIRQPGRI